MTQESGDDEGSACPAGNMHTMVGGIGESGKDTAVAHSGFNQMRHSTISLVG